MEMVGSVFALRWKKSAQAYAHAAMAKVEFETPARWLWLFYA